MFYFVFPSFLTFQVFEKKRLVAYILKKLKQNARPSVKTKRRYTFFHQGLHDLIFQANHS